LPLGQSAFVLHAVLPPPELDPPELLELEELEPPELDPPELELDEELPLLHGDAAARGRLSPPSPPPRSSSPPPPPPPPPGPPGPGFPEAPLLEAPLEPDDPGSEHPEPPLEDPSSSLQPFSVTRAAATTSNEASLAANMGFLRIWCRSFEFRGSPFEDVVRCRL
jgi:hypothetical protein